MKRREFFTLAATAVAVAGCGGSEQAGGQAQAPAAPEPPAPEPKEEELVEYLFVQHFQNGSLKDNVLTLEGVAAQTMFFSDRPDRIVGRELTEDFVDAWDEGDDSFAEVPPNAVLTVVRDQESRDLVIVLKDPVLTGDTLVYQVDVLDGPKEAEGVYGTVFIDVVGAPMRRQTRRVSRRTARRTTRRVNRRDDMYDDDSDHDHDSDHDSDSD